MIKLKSKPPIYKNNKKLQKNGLQTLSKSDLLTILLGSEIKNKNKKRISKNIIKSFGDHLMDIRAEDLQKISGISRAKAVQIIAAISLAKKFYEEKKGNNYQVFRETQDTLFDLQDLKKQSYDINTERIKETYYYIPKVSNNHFQLQNRRYIGNKHKLIEWVFSIINSECKKGGIFADIFAGTASVSAVASRHFREIILNDFLHSNHAIYQAFFGNGQWNKNKIDRIIRDYNNISSEDLQDNYFSKSFGGKYFSHKSSKIIGFIRENIEENKNNLTIKEYYILIASLLYSIDKIANTVGHYDAYFKKDYIEDGFFMKPIEPINVKNARIFREDTNELVKKIKCDIAYIDPPYNSRQYSRFYHVLENLTKWDKPKLYGTALKPEPENMSDYCRVNAKNKFKELIRDIDAKYLVISYNNTYDSKSNSSRNKMTLKDINSILSEKGKTKVFEKDYRHFNAGNTNFKNHKEYLFVTRVNQ